MRNKRNLILVLLFLLNMPIFCAAPSWLTELEKYYPTNEYLRMIGEGSSLKQAENEAVAAVAQNFNTKIKVINQAIKEYNSIITEDKSESSKSYSFHQESKISSDADFLLLKYSEPYYDKKNKKYYVVGYIDRKEASNYYSRKIEELMIQIKAICELAKKEREILYTVLNYQKAERLYKIASYYIDTVCTINPLESDKYKEYTDFISELQEKQLLLKKKVSFFVSCKDAQYNSLCIGISSILEESAFLISKNNSTYRIVVEIHFNEEVYEAGNFVRPDISIIVSNINGQEIESYSKVYPRYSHQTMANAYNLALVRIQQDLEENFLIDYRNVE